MFLKNRHSNVCLKFLCNASMRVENAFFFFFSIFLVKIGSENSIFIPRHPQIIYFWIRLFFGATYQGGEEAKAGRGTDEQPGKPPLIIYGETYSTWQWQFKFKFFRGTKKKFFVKKLKEKGVTFCFIKLNANRFLNIISGKQLYNKKYHQKLNHF